MPLMEPSTVFEDDDVQMWQKYYPLCSPTGQKKLPISIVYVPSHLYHMLFELFKVPHPDNHQRLPEQQSCLHSFYCFMDLFLFVFFIECYESHD